jgi:hypothetical protein
MKTSEYKDQKGSPIIMAPAKEKEVSKKSKETENRIANSAPEQFAELKETNLRMKEEEIGRESVEDEEQ